MSDSNVKQKTLVGAVWKFAERILAQAVSLIVSITLARLLAPTDYGVVGIVTVFFVFANVIISGGLNTALIQKKDSDTKDYNTVFTVSFFVSLIIYIALFFAAPSIAQLYKQDILINIIRIMGLSLPIYALKSIVCAYVSANMQFRKFFFATLGGTLISAVVGIVLALNGAGAWALVAQQLTNTSVDTLVLFCTTKLKLRFQLSFERLKTLLKYGSKILISSLLGVVFNQINPLVIGLKYTSADLSFYTKGRTFPETLSSSITYTISSVLFPALSKYQDDKKQLLHCTRLYMRVASFIVFPIMLGFFGVSENFVSVLLTDKWLPAVYYIRVACIVFMFDVVAAGNCETIKAMGRSDIFLKIEVIKKTAYFITIILFLLFTDSPEMLAISTLICTAIQIVVNSQPNKKLLGYRFIYQIMDIVPNFIVASVMCLCVLLLGRLPLNPVPLLLLQIIGGGIVYLLLAIVTRNSALKVVFDILLRHIKTKT